MLRAGIVAGRAVVGNLGLMKQVGRAARGFGVPWVGSRAVVEVHIVAFHSQTIAQYPERSALGKLVHGARGARQQSAVQRDARSAEAYRLVRERRRGGVFRFLAGGQRGQQDCDI